MQAWSVGVDLVWAGPVDLGSDRMVPDGRGWL